MKSIIEISDEDFKNLDAIQNSSDLEAMLGRKRIFDAIRNSTKLKEETLVYNQNNTSDLRDKLINACKEVFGNIDYFFDFIDDEDYNKDTYDVIKGFDDESYIINRETGEYINWYKFYHFGRDVHTTVNSDNFVKFFKEFKG